MVHQKIDPRISTIFFEVKNSKASLTTTLIWRLLYKLTLNVYSLILFQLPFSPSFESLFHQTNVRDSAVIQAQAFSVAQNVPKWRQRVNKYLFSHGTVCTSTFWGDPLLDPLNYEKGPPKITEGGPFDPHWLISRINPLLLQTKSSFKIQTWYCTAKRNYCKIPKISSSMYKPLQKYKPP